MDSRQPQLVNSGTLVAMDIHEETDREFGGCGDPDCPSGDVRPRG